MARISILLTDTMIQALERIQRVQPLAARAGVMSTALEAGLISLANGTAMPTVTSKAKRRMSSEPAECQQRPEPSDTAVVDIPVAAARNSPEVTAAHVRVGSSPPGDPDWAFLDELVKGAGTVKGNPFTGE